MNKNSFMKRYNTFFESIGRNPTSPRVDADTLKWLPLMFIVVSLKDDHAHDSLPSPHSLHRTSSSRQLTSLRGPDASTDPREVGWNMPRLCRGTILMSFLPVF